MWRDIWWWQVSRWWDAPRQLAIGGRQVKATVRYHSRPRCRVAEINDSGCQHQTRMRTQTNAPLGHRWPQSATAQPLCKMAWRFLIKPNMSYRVMQWWDSWIVYLWEVKACVHTNVHSGFIHKSPRWPSMGERWAHCGMLLSDKNEPTMNSHGHSDGPQGNYAEVQSRN